MFRIIVVIAVTLIVCVAPVAAGPALDEILNYMYLDQTTPIKPRFEFFLVDSTTKLQKDQPLGQTFVTGPEVEKIVRIRTWIDPDSDWQPGEGVELALWDSPAKKVCLGRYTIWYEYRGFQFSRTEFEVNARVKPNTAYYFEMSYVGLGDGTLSRVGQSSGEMYAAGQGYVAGKESDLDLCFQTHVKRPMDRVGNLRKMFARFDLSRPELAEVKAAVDSEDFDTAQARLVAYFEAKKHPHPVIIAEDVPKHNPDFDTTEGDLAMQNHFASSEMGRGYAGPDINWRAESEFNPDGTIAASYWNTGLNRFGPRGPLTKAYLNTGNEKYAKKLNDVLIDYYLDNPPPELSKLGGDGSDPVWATLDAGIRVGAMFVAYSRMHKSPFFTLDGRMAFILHIADCADTLVLNGEIDGGNWSFTQNSSMLALGVNFAEFTNAPTWRQTAIRRLSVAIKRDILPDGVETEAAPGYQRMSYGPLVGVYELIRDRGLEAPFANELRGIIEKQAEYFMYLAAPHGFTPFMGDWGNTHERVALVGDAELYGRKDMLYVSSAGKQGEKPKELSKMYPHFGVATLRSDWGDAGRPYEDARYLMLHSVHYGAHGHQDLNGITAYAYGRELLGDPGSYEYGSPEHDLLCKAVSHNVLVVDGKEQKWRAGGEFKNWATTPVADYVHGSYNAYETGATSREVLYVRTNGDSALDYWVVRDIAEGTGSHTLDQRWHFVVDSGATVDRASLTAKTNFETGGNLAIMQIDPSRLKAEQSEKDTWSLRGNQQPPGKMPTVVYSTSTELPAGIDTVLFPYEGKAAPGKLVTLEKSADGLGSAFKIVQGKVSDLFVFQKSAGAKSIASEKISFDGERLFVRRVNGKLRSLVLVNGANASVDGKPVIKLAKPEKWVVVEFGKTGKKEYDSGSVFPLARLR